MAWEELLQLTEASIDAMDINELRQLVKILLSWYKKLYIQINSDGKNTNKPSSQQIYQKPQPTRQKTDRKPGWQIGHIGKTLMRKENPDTRIFVKDQGLWDMKKMQVIDIVPPVTTCTEYLIVWEESIIEWSVVINQEELPKYITWPVQYWPNIRTFVLYLRNHSMMPYGKIKDLMKEFWNLEISEWTLEWFDRDFAKKINPWYDKLKETATKEKLLHTDETWIRVEGGNGRMHSLSNSTMSLFAFHENRWTKAIESMGVLEKYKGILIHDFWASYFAYDQCVHGMCGAHLLRELQRIIDYEAEWKQRATQMKSLLLTIKTSVQEWDNSNLSQYMLDYDAICASAKQSYPEILLSWKRWKTKQMKGKNLLDRFIQHKENILRFATNDLVPFTNNQAERDLRMNKVKMKVSWCFRSSINAGYFAIIRSFFETTKKQGWSLVSAIFSQLTYAVS